jgi:uncharacterized protein YqgC (DUF456 family)
MLGVAAGLAALEEVFECVLGAAGSRRTGGSTRAAAMAVVGSLIGGIMGTALPVPMVGTLLGNLWAGRPLFPSVEAGWAAAEGQL